MLFALFTLGDARFALEAAHVVEILPLLDIQPIPNAPPTVLGVCSYHGAALTVIDLNRVAGQPPAPRLLSTRLLVVRDPTRDAQRETAADRHIALLAAGVTETIQFDSTQFVPDPTGAKHAPWLGSLVAAGNTFIRRIEIAPLFHEL